MLSWLDMQPAFWIWIFL